jgi:hypothetical protein
MHHGRTWALRRAWHHRQLAQINRALAIAAVCQPQRQNAPVTAVFRWCRWRRRSRIQQHTTSCALGRWRSRQPRAAGAATQLCQLRSGGGPAAVGVRTSAAREELPPPPCELRRCQGRCTSNSCWWPRCSRWSRLEHGHLSACTRWLRDENLLPTNAAATAVAAANAFEHLSGRLEPWSNSQRRRHRRVHRICGISLLLLLLLDAVDIHGEVLRRKLRRRRLGW